VNSFVLPQNPFSFIFIYPSRPCHSGAGVSSIRKSASISLPSLPSLLSIHFHSPLHFSLNEQASKGKEVGKKENRLDEWDKQPQIAKTKVSPHTQ
jgi:hypothetical protein